MTPISKAFTEYNQHISSVTTFAPLTVYDHFSAGYEAAQRDKQSLPPVERIKADAREYCKDQALGSREDCSYCIPDYIAGATVENSRAQVLVDALEWIKTSGPVDELTVKFIDKQLRQWKGKEVKPQQTEPQMDLGICVECKTRPATTDYNGHQHYVCQLCDDSLSRQFDEEYR